MLWRKAKEVKRKPQKIPPENKRTEEVSDSDDDDEEMPGLEDSANADGDKKDDVSFNFCEFGNTSQEGFSAVVVLRANVKAKGSGSTTQ